MKRILIIENTIISLEGISSWFENSIIGSIPSHTIRLLYYRYCSHIRIGRETSIALYTEIRAPRKIVIGENCAINQRCYLDGRGKLIIGNNVNIGRCVSIYTASHDYNNSKFPMITKPVQIGNDVWIASHAIVLPGVGIGKGAVIAAGAVVTKDVEEFSVVAGNPAKEVRKRNMNIEYKTSFFRMFY